MCWLEDSRKLDKLVNCKFGQLFSILTSWYYKEITFCKRIKDMLVYMTCILKVEVVTISYASFYTF